MKNKSGMPQVFGLVLQVLGLLLFMIVSSRVLPVGLVILGAVILLASVSLKSHWSLPDQYSATMTLFSLVLMLYYALFGFRLSTNALMLAGLATAFVLEITLIPQKYGKEKAHMKKTQNMPVPSVETYYEELSEDLKAADPYAEKKLDDEKRRIIDELSDIQEEIITLADDVPEAKKADLKMLFGKKDGKTYHTLDCLSLKNSNRKDLNVFNSVGEARKNGYKPCKICKP